MRVCGTPYSCMSLPNRAQCHNRDELVDHPHAVGVYDEGEPSEPRDHNASDVKIFMKHVGVDQYVPLLALFRTSMTPS